MMRPIMRTAVSALAVCAGLSAVAVGASTTGSVIDFENMPTGHVYYVYSSDGHGPFAISGVNELGNGNSVVVSATTGHNQMLSVIKPPPDCSCTYLYLDLSACDAGYVALQSFRILGTTTPAKVVYFDRGGNPLPSTAGQIVN